MDDYSMVPHVPLEWNSSHQQVVAKQSLVGLSWSSLAASSRVEKAKRLHKYLADVVEVPDEVFALENLHQVLSIETWNSCLSDLEKEHLCGLLPQGCDIEKAITALLAGENVNFGNPLTSWGELACSRAMHPDVVVLTQARIHNERKNYRVSLRKFHQTMIQNLQQLKTLWKACKTQENICAETQRWIRARKPASLLLQNSHLVNGDNLSDITDEAYLRQRLKRRRSLVPESAVERANAAVELAMNEWYKAVDGSSTELRTIMVTRKQFIEIANRKSTGADLRLDTLKDVLGCSTRLQTSDEHFKSYWHSLARKDLPEVHKAFMNRVSGRKELATLVAKQCMHRYPKSEKKNSGAVMARPKALSLLPTVSSTRFLPERCNANGKLDTTSVNSQSLLYYQRVGVPSEDDELASIQELWSYNCLQDAPIHL
ncbi:nuclear factor related to kappa-B-binding protein [Selaginella moellendorffii]|uniref:nuclear factor related to kappa-B-binding protein n=1 Tax=Selaginella moellendorffii TaxID=88036 RepID=UPI000D1C3C82|nr:nuclear factor related to kappa-B-binding protein [Selaginella moellendorffii]|eukprot:XP_024531589.1 nuclear factor related to kappa-B-binding protein [Selaginella moellendorffii]